MRISATVLESFRLYCEFDWMDEAELQASIRGEFVPNHKVRLGKAFGAVLEAPERFIAPGGYRCEGFEFGADVMEPCLRLFDRRGVFEAKAVKRYGDHVVVSKADQLLGARVIENKATLSTFDFDKYAGSYQWRFYVDAFEPAVVTYNVFCLDEAVNGAISLRGIETFNLFPYAYVSEDCAALVREFVRYVNAKGLGRYLDRTGSGLEAA